MNVIPGAMAGLLAGLSVNIEAQSTVDHPLYLSAPDLSGQMDKAAYQEADLHAPSIELGNISLRAGIRGRNIKFYSSFNPLPGLDQALARCDGNQATGWVSYQTMSITCLQGGVERKSTIQLPPPDQKMQLEEAGSKILIAEAAGNKARPVVDSTILAAAAAIQFDSPFDIAGRNSSYAISGIRRLKDNSGNDRVIVDLCVIGESNEYQPLTDGNSFSGMRKCPGPLSHWSGKKSGKHSDTGDDENPEETPPSKPPRGGDGGDGDDPDKTAKKSDIVTILSIEVDIKQLIKELQKLIDSASPEQRIVITERLTQLIGAFPEGELLKTESDNGESANQIAILLTSSQDYFDMASNVEAVSAVRNTLRSIFNGLGSGEPIGAILQTLRDSGDLQQLQKIPPEETSQAQDEDDEALPGAVADSGENSEPVANRVVDYWRQIIIIFLEIKITPTDSEPAPEDKTTPERKEDQSAGTGQEPVTIWNPEI